MEVFTWKIDEGLMYSDDPKEFEEKCREMIRTIPDNYSIGNGYIGYNGDDFINGVITLRVYAFNTEASMS